MRRTISHGLLRWKLEMHMTFENRLYPNAYFFSKKHYEISITRGEKLKGKSLTCTLNREFTRVKDTIYSSK